MYKELGTAQALTARPGARRDDGICRSNNNKIIDSGAVCRSATRVCVCARGRGLCCECVCDTGVVYPAVCSVV